MSEKIFYTKPSITELEISYANDAAVHGWGEKCYEYIDRFEKRFCEHLGVKHAIATSSCTGALHMGLAALGIGVGDEVILADTNWIATVAPVTYLGAKPVFVDISPDSWCLDPEKVEEAITPRTRAIIAVHIYGNLCDMDALMLIGEKHGIPVIEDAAEAIGSIYHGKRAGSIGAFGTFSFHGTKTVSTGEGGMIVTNDSELFETLLTLSNHGRSKTQTKQFWPDKVGFKYKMSNIQAAIGCAQLERIEELIDRKREIFLYYKNAFKSTELFNLNPEAEGTVNGFWMPTICFKPDSGITRQKVQAELIKNDIDARVVFYPLSSLPMFTSPPANVNSYDFNLYAINLPSYHDMTSIDLSRIVSVILNFCEKQSRID